MVDNFCLSMYHSTVHINLDILVISKSNDHVKWPPNQFVSKYKWEKEKRKIKNKQVGENIEDIIMIHFRLVYASGLRASKEIRWIHVSFSLKLNQLNKLYIPV